ncbi:MAG: metallophosphoesterase, partial [Candidatus Thermoplasmatota archaeon]
SDWDAKLFTWYSEFRLNVTSIAYEEPYWKLDLEIPKYVFEDLYNLKIMVAGASDTEEHAVSVVNELKDKFDFIYITDVHIGDKKGTYAKFANVIEEINLIHPDFVIDTGDCSDKMPWWYEEQEIPPEQQDQKYNERIVKNLGLDVPIYVVPGNHDYSYAISSSIEDFKKWINPVLNFGFEYGNYAYFVGIDSQNTHPGIGYQGGNGLNDSQIDWLENQLKAHIHMNHRFVFMHHKPSNETISSPAGEEPYLEQNADVYRELIRKYNVTFSLHGHEHRDWIHDRNFTPIAEDGSIDFHEYPLFVVTTSATNAGGAELEGYRLIRVNGTEIDSYTYDGDGNGIRDDLESIPTGKISVKYSGTNDGTADNLTATITNELNESFENAELKFLMAPLEPGKTYKTTAEYFNLSGGAVPQQKYELKQVINTPGKVAIAKVLLEIPKRSKVNVTVELEPDDKKPEIIDVWSCAGMDKDNVYQVGKEIEFTVIEAHGKSSLQGNITITSAEGGSSSQLVYALKEEGWGVYFYLWNTTNVTLGVYQIETALWDAIGNIDPDGLPITPDLTLRLVDEIPPTISKVLSSVGSDKDGRYEVGSTVKISVIEQYCEEGLTGIINITSESVDFEPKIQNKLLKEEGGGVYYYEWNTSGLKPADDYKIEITLSDSSQNTARTSINITLEDTTPPVISAVVSSVGSDKDGIYELGSTVKISVIELYGEEGLAGTITITSPTYDFEPKIQNKVLKEEGGGVYYYEWNTSGLKPANNYEVETTLTDAYQNADKDGLLGTDLVIVLVPPPDITPPERIENVGAYDVPRDQGGAIIVSWKKCLNSANDFLMYNIYISTKEFVNVSELKPEKQIYDINIVEAILTTCNGKQLLNGQAYYVGVVAVDENFNMDTQAVCAGPIIPIDNLPPIVESFSPFETNLTINESYSIEFAVNISSQEPDKNELKYAWYLDNILVKENMSKFVFFAEKGLDGNKYYLKVIIKDMGGNIVEHNWTINVQKPTPTPLVDELENGELQKKEADSRVYVVACIIIFVCLCLTGLFLKRRKKVK